MRIALTGGAGFIGSHLGSALLAAGHELLVIDDLSSGDRARVPAAATFVHADIRSNEAAAALRAFRPQVLDHHAAQVDVRKSIADPRLDCEVNLGGLIAVVEASRQAGALERVLLASSGGTIYGEVEAPRGATEQLPAAPLSPYGVTKRASELYLEMFRQLYGLRHVCLRYSNVFGPGQNPDAEAGVVAIFAARCLRAEESTIFGDGNQIRDFVYVEDVVRANLLALTAGFCGVVNIGTGVGTGLNRLYQAIAATAGSPRPARHAPARTGELHRNVLDPTFAGQALGWRPTVTLEEGVRRTVDWLRANPAHPRR